MSTPTEIRQQIDALLDQLVPPVSSSPPPSALLDTPDALDRALATATPGAVLTLAPTLVYPAPLTIRVPVTLQAARLPPGRMTVDAPLPRFLAGLAVPSPAVTLLGLDVRHTNPLTDIVTLQGAGITLDRCRILGDPGKGAKRGIAANTDGQCTILRTYIDDCFQSYPGNDSQAICGWDMGPGLVIADCYLSAGSETVLIGGADPASVDRLPRQIAITGCTLTKKAAWQALPIGVKNTLELKAARHVLIDHNDISYSWGGRGQDGYSIMCTTRNQNGAAPYSTIEDVTITNNRMSHAGAAINVLATDDNHPSQVLTRVTIAGNSFTDLDVVKYHGSPRLIQIGAGPIDLTIDQNTFEGTGFTSAVYFYGKPPAERLTITKNQWPITKYKIFGAASTVGNAPDGLPNAWHDFVTSGVLSGNIEH